MTDQSRPTEQPLDSKALRERGYTKPETYALLRRWGVKTPGGRKKRISRDLLARYERGELKP